MKEFPAFPFDKVEPIHGTEGVVHRADLPMYHHSIGVWRPSFLEEAGVDFGFYIASMEFHRSLGIDEHRIQGSGTWRGSNRRFG